MSRWMHDMSVTARVVTVFGLIVLLTGLMTGLVTKHTSTLERITNDLHSRQYVALHTLADMRRQAEQLYAIKQRRLLSASPSDRALTQNEEMGILERYEQLEHLLLAQTPEGAMQDTYAEIAIAWHRMQKNGATLTENADDKALIRNFRKHASALEALQRGGLEESGRRVTTTLRRMLHAVYIAQFALVALGFAGCFAVACSISHPVQQITRLTSEMSAGRLDVAIPALARRDEIGRLAAALDTLRLRSLEVHQLAQEQQRRAEALESLFASFDSSVSDALRAVTAANVKLENAAGEMRRSASPPADSTVAQVLAAARALSQESGKLKGRIEHFFGELRRS